VKVVAPPQGDVAIHFVPAQHWSSRTPWERNATLWGGFVAQSTVQRAPYSMFFSGDTGYSKDFADIGARFGGFDFSQIAAGCCLPRWFMQQQHLQDRLCCGAAEGMGRARWSWQFAPRPVDDIR
jgi:N-acyl-phosphatidylethanolamine-hydrolysing phospholipase D